MLVYNLLACDLKRNVWKTPKRLISFETHDTEALHEIQPKSEIKCSWGFSYEHYNLQPLKQNFVS